MAFDIAAALGDIGRRPDGEDRFEQIELHMIDQNPKNFYSMAGIEELADGIRMSGLLTPLRVKREESGRYMLISGHRRREAMRRLAEDPDVPEWDFHRKVPCIVEAQRTRVAGIEDPEAAEKAGPLMEELRLIFANSDTRQMTSADTATQVRRLREILTELKELGADLPGKLRDHVAAAAGVSATRVARLDVIEKNLTEPTLRKAWKDGTLGETSAYEIARRSAEAQRKAAMHTGPDNLMRMTTEQITTAMDYYEEKAEEDRKAREEWNKSVGAMTEATETATAVENVKSDFSPDAYLEKLHRENEIFFERLDEVADRFYDGLEYVTNRREGIEFLKRMNCHHSGSAGDITFQGSPKGLTLEDDFEDGITRTWTEVFDELALAALRYVARGKVSAVDTEDEDGEPDETDLRIAAAAPAWCDGEPEQDGRYFCRVLIGKDAKPHEQRMEWRSGGWWVFGDPADKFDMAVQSWWPLPPEV